MKRGRIRIVGEPRSGRPKTATIPKIIGKVYEIVSEDPNITKLEIADTIGI